MIALKNCHALLSALFSLATFWAIQACAQTNPGFENGLSGWMTAGKTTSVQLIHDKVYKGNAAIRLGAGNAEVAQRIKVGQLALVQIFGFGKVSDTSTKGVFFIRFYNGKGKLLLVSKSNPVTNAEYTNDGVYTETPAHTQYILAGVSKTAGRGYLDADDIEIKTNMGEPSVKPKPQVDLDQYMRPFWKSDTIFNETVLLYSGNDNIAKGNLLSQPDKILSVKSFDGKTEFKPGIDYDWKKNEREITRFSGSNAPFRADTSFENKKGYGWYNLQSQWVVVTYTHKDRWEGPIPGFKGNQLPNTLKKLKSGQPLRIVALGMSITRGMDVSSYDLQPPYMPTYMELFASELKKNYRNHRIELFNAGLPGSKIDWGAIYTDQYVNALKPDLVILDFGMNDFWQYSPEEYKSYMQTIIRKLKKANPAVEIILLSVMKFDPEYLADSDPKKMVYQGNLTGYNPVLQSLQTKGIINLDMTSISDWLYKKKKPKDCITNPLHPNDYMARWYAQGMAALLIQ